MPEPPGPRHAPRGAGGAHPAGRGPGSSRVVAAADNHSMPPDRARRALAALWLLASSAGAAAQEPATPAPVRTAAEWKRGARTPPTHAPQPTLPPLVAWQHLQAGNAAAVAALAAGKPMPAPPERPSGAGRYVCAVLACADADLDLPPLLGLRRRDVLWLAVPGPFATPETVALLERIVVAERVPLVLVLGHASCRALAGGRNDALATRTAAVAAEAARRGQPAVRTLVELQRDLLLAAADELRARTQRDELRVLPAEIDERTGALAWHHRAIDALPLAPVK